MPPHLGCLQHAPVHAAAVQRRAAAADVCDDVTDVLRAPDGCKRCTHNTKQKFQCQDRRNVSGVVRVVKVVVFTAHCT